MGLRISNKVLEKVKGNLLDLLVNTSGNLSTLLLQKVTQDEELINSSKALITKLVKTAVTPEIADKGELPCETEYKTVITDDMNPFIITDKLRGTVRDIISGDNTDEQKAYSLFQWVRHNISYGEHKRKNNIGYRTSDETFNTMEGVCGESAILYIVMARAAGLIAYYVSVFTDCKGRVVHHACSQVILKNKVIYPDITYENFDCKHRSYKVLSDEECIAKFKSFRSN